MSHVLALLPHTPGKYDLKYELTTLIYPFEKQRTSSPVEGSREIAQLLVPTDPGGADRGWDGTLSLHEWVWPSWYYTHITNTHFHHTLVLLRGQHGSIPPLWGLSSVEDATRRSSDGSQTMVHIWHERGGLYILHTSLAVGGHLWGISDVSA